VVLKKLIYVHMLNGFYNLFYQWSKLNLDRN
jgi:hypothetical protein